MFSPSFYRSGTYIARLAKYGKLRGINRSFQGSASLLSIEVNSIVNVLGCLHLFFASLGKFLLFTLSLQKLDQDAILITNYVRGPNSSVE